MATINDARAEQGQEPFHELSDVHDLAVQVQKVLDADYSIRSAKNDYTGRFEVTLSPFAPSVRMPAVGEGQSFVKAWAEAYGSLPLWFL